MSEAEPAAVHAANPIWRAVIPVKGGPHAKSRITLANDSRAALATALAVDTISTAAHVLGVEGVLVVTSDPGVSAWAAGEGIPVMPDPGEGLNAALNQGIDAWLEVGVSLTEPLAIAAIMGDLPAMSPEHLKVVLHAAREHQSSFVPDAADEGTTILLGRIPTARFGPASQARHLAAGAAPLLAPLGARLDVDTLEDLQAAAELGLGERTAAVAARLGLL